MSKIKEIEPSIKNAQANAALEKMLSKTQVAVDSARAEIQRLLSQIPSELTVLIEWHYGDGYGSFLKLFRPDPDGNYILGQSIVVEREPLPLPKKYEELRRITKASKIEVERCKSRIEKTIIKQYGFKKFLFK